MCMCFGESDLVLHTVQWLLRRKFNELGTVCCNDVNMQIIPTCQSDAYFCHFSNLNVSVQCVLTLKLLI
jgi:hypothetical protein